MTFGHWDLGFVWNLGFRNWDLRAASSFQYLERSKEAAFVQSLTGT
jgi:hypothetical protein